MEFNYSQRIEILIIHKCLSFQFTHFIYNQSKKENQNGMDYIVNMDTDICSHYMVYWQDILFQST